MGISEVEFHEIMKNREPDKCIICGKPSNTKGSTLCRGHHSAFHRKENEYKKTMRC